RDLLGLALDGDSLLVTWDPRNRRVTYFGTDGTLRRSFLPQIPSVLFGADVFEVDAQRRVIIQVDAREETNVYMRFAPDGTVIDTLRGSTAGEQGFMVNSPEGARYTFVRKLLAKPTPLGGLLRGSTRTLGFTVDLAGRTRTVERRTT